MSQPGTVLIRLSANLLDGFGTRTDDGKKLTFKLGKPEEVVINVNGAQPENVYAPIIGYVDDGMRMVTEGYLEYLENHQLEGGAR